MFRNGFFYEIPLRKTDSLIKNPIRDQSYGAGQERVIMKTYQ